MRNIAIAVHLDSLGEMVGFDPAFVDPTYTKILPRFVDFAEEKGAPLSLYAVGKDLENQDSIHFLQQSVRSGHEIGCHSFSHAMWLPGGEYEEIRADITKATNIIKNEVGVCPRGYVSPGWCTSPAMYEILAELGYEYDISAFPTWLSQLNYVHWVKTYWKQPGLLRARWKWLFRNLRSCIRSRHPHVCHTKKKPVRVLPVPTNRLRLACWHSLAYVLPWTCFERLLRSCLRSTQYFHYVMHPVDLMAPEDLVGAPSYFDQPRFVPPLSKRLELLEAVWKIFEAENAVFTTVGSLVDGVICWR